MIKAFEPASSSRSDPVGFVPPTLNVGEHLGRMVHALHGQTPPPARFPVVDSSSDGYTVAGFRAADPEVWSIPRESFDHGGMRQIAADILGDLALMVFLIQDAIPAHPGAFAKLPAGFKNRETGMAYGWQLPSPGTGPLGAHARLFNHPGQSQLGRLADASLSAGW